MKPTTLLLLLAASLSGAGCATSHNVNVAPIHVAPIRMTMDINVNVHETGGEDGASEAPDAGAQASAQSAPDG
ncbi:MAG: hypothetical protein M5U28_53185 [Sandaracinaceae bacterium]|nr:hypothetical protein [Sandaracinaceae bacterium]